MNLVLHEPVGVVAHVLPFDYPLVLLAWQAAAALAAGNACIVKPSELTPLSTLMLGEVFDALPDGLFNALTATARARAGSSPTSARTWSPSRARCPRGSGSWPPPCPA